VGRSTIFELTSDGRKLRQQAVQCLDTLVMIDAHRRSSVPAGSTDLRKSRVFGRRVSPATKSRPRATILLRPKPLPNPKNSGIFRLGLRFCPAVAGIRPSGTRTLSNVTSKFGTPRASLQGQYAPTSIEQGYGQCLARLNRCPLRAWLEATAGRGNCSRNFILAEEQQHLAARIICTETWNGCLSGRIGTSCL
jgi:hypothetical protein